jgi:tetratricopeptide (TPR) repeat protein
MTLNSLGLLYNDNSAHKKAQSAYEEALEIYRTLAKTNPDTYLSEIAMTLNSLGLLYSDNNAHTKAQSAYEGALEIYRTLAKTNPDSVNFQGFFVSVLCFCMCVVAIVKTAKIVDCHCHLR